MLKSRFTLKSFIFVTFVFAIIISTTLYTVSINAGSTETLGGTSSSNTNNTKVLQVDYQSKSILGTNNEKIVLRGVQVPLVYSGLQASSLESKTTEKIASYGFNFVRITWASISQGNIYNNTTSVLTKFIQNCYNNNLIAMPECHDITGQDTNLRDIANYWASLYPTLKPYEHHLMINIANEWGGNSIDNNTFVNEYKEAIKIIRNAGYICPIVIDAGGWGQEIPYLSNNWQTFVDADRGIDRQRTPNIMFDVHMYGHWAVNKSENNAKYYVDQEFLNLHRVAPVMIGEFGWNKPGNADNSKIIVDKFINIVKSNNVNLCVYSWSGGNPRYKNDAGQLLDYSYLDVVPSTLKYYNDIDFIGTFRNDELTEFGKKMIFNGVFSASASKANFAIGVPTTNPVVDPGTNPTPAPAPYNNFEANTEGWTGQVDYSRNLTTTISSDWAVSGTKSLKADINLGLGTKYAVQKFADVNFAGKTKLSVVVKASGATLGQGLSAKIFVKTGSSWTWFDSGSVTLTSGAAKTMTLNLTSVTNLDNVRDIGVEFFSNASAGVASVYLDNVVLQ